MKLRVRSTDTELSFLETLALAIYFVVEINVELAVQRPIYIAAVLFMVLSILLSNRVSLEINSYVTWTILWALVIGFSILYSISPSTTITSFLTVCARGLAFITILSRVNNEKLLYSVLKILFVVELFNILYVMSKVNILLLGSKRIGAIVNMDSDVQWNSNTISAVLAECVFISLCLLRNNEIKHRFITIMVTVFYAVIILLCGSRMGLLLLIGTPLVWLGISSNRRNLFVRVFVVLIASIGIYYIVMYVPAIYYVLGHRVETLIRSLLGQSATDLSIVGRQKLISYGLSWIPEHPLLGHGMYTFKEQLAISYGYEMYAHNNYIEILFGTGMIGLAVYYSLYIHLLVQAWRVKYSHWQVVVSVIVVIMVAEMASVSFKKFAFQFALAILFMVQKLGINQINNESRMTHDMEAQ